MTIFTKEDVGKDVKCLLNGNGEISGFNDCIEHYQVYVDFKSGASEVYTQQGKLEMENVNTALSFGHFDGGHNE